jgi:hypothetical protein
MRDEQHRFLNLLRQPPARLTAEQAAWMLNCQPHDIPVLIAARLLKPLGSPQPNSVKYFATAEIVSLAQDRPWLGKMTSAISRHWQTRNQRKLPRGLAVAEPPAPEQFRLSA